MDFTLLELEVTNMVRLANGGEHAWPWQTKYAHYVWLLHLILQSNLYITVTLGKWPCDRYIQGDRSTQVPFKLPWKSINNIFVSKE